MTSFRRLVLATAAVLLIGMGPVVSDADAKKKHKHDAYCRHDRSDHRDHRDARWHRDHDRNDRARYDHLGRRQTGRDRRDDPRYHANLAKCAEIDERIHKGNEYIGRWRGTGRHEKAQEWFHKDLRKAHAERAQYCGGRASGGGDWWRDTAYDNRRYDDDWYDGRYYGEDRDFDFKRDWPSMLGIFGGLNGGAN